jgi:Immunity protein 42
MIVGDPSSFAIESEISRAYLRASLRGLGFFVIHLGSAMYGVRALDATMLACSFDEVEKRLVERGRHIAPFSSEPDAGKLADAICQSIYAAEGHGGERFGLPSQEFRNLLSSNDIVWAPDGDEAFDDGSCVVQFDEGDRVRLVGFRYDDAYRHQPSSTRDIWIGADQYYSTLERWRSAFAAEWEAALRVPET